MTNNVHLATGLQLVQEHNPECLGSRPVKQSNKVYGIYIVNVQKYQTCGGYHDNVVGVLSDAHRWLANHAYVGG